MTDELNRSGVEKCEDTARQRREARTRLAHRLVALQRQFANGVGIDRYMSLKKRIAEIEAVLGGSDDDALVEYENLVLRIGREVRS